MSPPDILFILTTQLRAQALAHAGDPNVRTPNLDALAATSRRFTQVVTPHPFGPFARAAILTGIPSPENGVRDYYDPLPTSCRTLAHDLNDRGYHTAFVGKWHLSQRDPHAPLVGETHARQIVPEQNRGGFQFWEGFESGHLLNNPWLHGTQLKTPQQFPGYQSNILCDRAADYFLTHTNANIPQPTPKKDGAAATVGASLDDARRQPADNSHAPQPPRPPLFLLLSLEAPHPPYDAPADGIHPLPPEKIQLRDNVPPGGETETRARRELSGYYAHIEATDHAIGKLLARLRQADAHPVIIFTSVHGDMHGSHGLFRKGWPHEESIRVPLLIRDPRQAAAIDDTLVNIINLPKWTRDFADNKNPFDKLPPPAAQTISMPSIVKLPHQCDRIWTATRTATTKQVLNADGTLWLRDL